MKVGTWRTHNVRSEILWTYALTMRTNAGGQDDLQTGITEAAMELVEWFGAREEENHPGAVGMNGQAAMIEVERAHRRVIIYGHVLRDESVEVWVYRIR